MSNTRTQIATEALALFAEKGLGGASMADIAAACGIQKSSIYSHFASKALLEDAVFDLCRSTLVEGVGALQVPEGPVEEALVSSALLLAEAAGGLGGLCRALVRSERLRDSRAAELDRQLFNMARARIEVLFDLKLNPLDSSLPAWLFCAGLGRLLDDGADSAEVERYCRSFLALTFARGTGSPQG